MHRLVSDILTITLKCTKDIFEHPVEEIHFGKAVGSNDFHHSIDLICCIA